MRRFVAVTVAVAGLAAGCGGTETSKDAGQSSATTTTESAAAEGFTIPADLISAAKKAGAAFEALTYPKQPSGVEWPTSAWPTGDISDGVDSAAVNKLVDDAIAQNAEGNTVDAVLIAQHGKLVVEKYGDWDPTQPHVSWSVAKSITQAMVGLLVRDGTIDPFSAVHAPEWSADGDKRDAITYDDLMTMSSGLKWDEGYTASGGDTIPMLYGAGKDDRAHFAADRELVADIGSTFNYSTGTPNILARAVTTKVGTGSAFESWFRKELLDPLGIGTVDFGFDASGVPSSGSNINLTPQDYLRFGYLYLRGGNWDGTQILPQSWVDFAHLPTTANAEHEYGRLWWIDTDRKGSFYADGFHGQFISVDVPHDVVIVIVSNTSTDRSMVLRRNLLDQFATGS